MYRILSRKITLLFVISMLVMLVNGCGFQKEKGVSQQNASADQINADVNNESLNKDEDNKIKEVISKINSGLLLGLSKENNNQGENRFKSKGDDLRTLWFFQDGEKLSYVEKKGVIITPYGDKFWRLENNKFDMKTEADSTMKT